jgi:hypothetical protein
MVSTSWDRLGKLIGACNATSQQGLEDIQAVGGLNRVIRSRDKARADTTGLGGSGSDSVGQSPDNARLGGSGAGVLNFRGLLICGGIGLAKLGDQGREELQQGLVADDLANTLRGEPLGFEEGLQARGVDAVEQVLRLLEKGRGAGLIGSGDEGRTGDIEQVIDSSLA